uniref:RRM domain-containing protein n=1 Tax=Glossina brevipalpis TaxID=37001 RepID=A0A1A9WBL5_9MUSC
MAFVSDINDNFSIINDRAYTEDNLLIYNVFLYTIPELTSDAELVEYFQQYGRIADLRTRKPLDHDPRYKPTKIGFLNFDDPNAATKVLKKRTHFLKTGFLQVKACDSWHQPDAYQLNIEQAVVEENHLIPSSALILNLNDDCLEIVCKNLELKDKIRFARTCKRFHDVFIMSSKITYKTLLLHDLRPLTLWQIRQFLEMVGPSIETLKGKIFHKHWTRLAEFLSFYCKNVKSVIFYDSTFKPRFLRRFLIGMTSLTVLELHDADLNDECIEILKESPNLKVLRLSKNYDLSGSVLEELPAIEELSLYSCSLQPTCLKDICVSMKGLRVLDVRRCDMLNTMAFKAIANNCRNLETLKISCYKSRYECIAKLPKLKNLELVAEISMRPELFIELAKHHSDQLEALTIKGHNCINSENISNIRKLKNLKIFRCSQSSALNNMWLRQLSDLSALEELDIAGCEGIANSGLLDFLGKSRKLRRLNIIRCKQLTEELVLDIYKIIKIRAQRLLVLAYGSGITTIDRNEIRNYSEFLQINFELPFPESRCYDDIDNNHSTPLAKSSKAIGTVKFKLYLKAKLRLKYKYPNIHHNVSGLDFDFIFLQVGVEMLPDSERIKKNYISSMAN